MLLQIDLDLQMKWRKGENLLWLTRY